MCSIKIATRDELHIIHLRQVAYFKADGHYTHVYFLNGSKLLVPNGLSKVHEKILAAGCKDYIPMWRSLLVNKSAICSLYPTKETILIHGSNGQMISVRIPKSVLRKAMADLF